MRNFFILQNVGNIFIVLLFMLLGLAIEMFDLSISTVTIKHLDGYKWLYPFTYIKSKSRVSSFLMLNLIYTTIIQCAIGHYSSSISVTVMVIINAISLYLNVVLRSCVLYHPAPVAYFLSYLVFVPGFIFQKLGWLIGKVGYLTLKLLGLHQFRKPPSLHAYRKELLWDIGQNFDLADEMEELKIVRSALEFRDVEVYKIMTEQEHFVTIQVDQTVDQIISSLKTLSKHRNLIAIDRSNHILGTVHRVDILAAYIYNNQEFNIYSIIKPPLFVAKNTAINALINHFVSHSKSSLFVIDSAMQIIGIITLHDLVQEIFGIDDDDQYFHRAQNGYIIDADYNIRMLNRKMNWHIPDQYITVGDFVVYLHSLSRTIHKDKEEVTWQHMSFRVLNWKNKQPYRVHIRVTPTSELLDIE
jgi:CBS domain containing-hemolysin-like protein